VETALDLQPKVDVFGTNYSTADGTSIRDYIQVSDFVRANCDAPAYLRRRGVSVTLNCDYGRGFYALEAIETVKRVCGVDFKVAFAGRRAGHPTQIVAASDHACSLLK
jgi:UDP-glucose 4-epimerase